MNDDQLQHLVGAFLQQGAQRQRTQISRDGIRDLIKQTAVCDGTNTAMVRLWIKEINLAYNQVGEANIIQIVTNTVASSLRFEIERFIDDYIVQNETDRAHVSWPLVRDHVTVQFLNINELQALRDEMDHTKQIAFEPTPQFARRFREIAEAAYSKNDRTADHEIIVIKGFARGLTSDSLARKLVEEIVPTTLDDAINAVARLNSRRDAYDRLGRNEEPMEVTAVRANDNEKLSKMVEKLSTKLAKIEIATQVNNDQQIAGPTCNQNRNRDNAPAHNQSRRLYGRDD